MRKKVEPLLCELHAHTRWSDGALTLPELVDLYGTNGFDVLAVTDHVLRAGSPWAGVDGRNHRGYIAEIAAQAERARSALVGARKAGAALIAAHPYRHTDGARPTQRFARDWSDLTRLIDRWELFNRHELFAWVAENGLPAVASGDFHRAEHLFGWKTLLPCAKREDAVVDYLRSGRPAFLARVDEVPLLRAA